MEVVEDEEVSEQVKELRARLASVSGQIEVSLRNQLRLQIMPVNCWSPQEVMKISESRRRQLERAALSVAENQRLHESVKNLEKILAGAHADLDKL